MRKRILITGATGFVGQKLLSGLSKNANLEIVAASRNPVVNDFAAVMRQVRIGEIDAETDWSDALQGVNVVIHLAARTHVICETEADPWSKFNTVNTLGTINLARQAADMGVRRFIYISSIKVNGEATMPGAAFRADDKPCPVGPYALSKYQAEKGLFRLMEETGMEAVIIRPPLVYGPGVKANFLSMMRWLRKGVPLPLGSVNNQRTLVSADNLANLLETCIDHPAAANQIFLVGDGEDLSTTELLKRTGLALGCQVRLFSVSTRLLLIASILIGKRQAMQRLCGSLQLDIGKTRDLLNWEPSVTVDVALKETADYFMETQPR